MWTRFMDMHSGGGTKEKGFEYIYIEAPESEARTIFYNKFGHNAVRVTCTCCGSDYSISEHESLDQATGFERGCAYEGNQYVERPCESFTFNEYLPLDEYRKRVDVLVICEQDINPSERNGIVPEQGYVWK